MRVLTRLTNGATGVVIASTAHGPNGAVIQAATAFSLVIPTDQTTQFLYALGLARIIHDSSSPLRQAQGPEHSRGTKSPSRVVRPAGGGVRPWGVLVQDVESPRGEPAGRKLVATADRVRLDSQSQTIAAEASRIMRVRIMVHAGSSNPNNSP